MSFFASSSRSKKPATSGFFTSPDIQGNNYDVTSVNHQIDNALTRVQDAGYNIGNADKRNWFEKMTNLPQGQNALFDTLELLGRPGSAVINSINTGVKGGDPLTGLRKGFSGQEKTTGADLAGTLGVKNKLGKAVLGTALDVGLDPTMYIPGAGFAKAAQLAGKGARAVGRGALGAVEHVAPQFAQDTLKPTIEATKDGLGRMFVPDYKLNETLHGTIDNTVKDLKHHTENNIRFQTEESMRNVADAAKLAGGVDKGTDVGRIMEQGLPTASYRPTSTDPKIQAAAQKLMESNNTIRSWAVENNIPVSELEGYMTHVLSAEERKLKNNARALPIDRGNFGTGQPNKKVISERKLAGSAEDVNQRLGRKIFEPNAFFASAIGQKRLIEYSNAVNFRGQVLSNPSFAQKFEKGMDIPKTATVIDSNNYKFLKDANDPLATNEVGGQYLVTKSVKSSLDRYQKLTTDEGVNSFLKGFDKLQSGWKRLALFSVPFHLRNDIGAKFNNWVGGMSLPEIAKYSAQADTDVYKAVVHGNESKTYREFREQGLGSSGLSSIEYARRGQDPEQAIQSTIEKRSQLDGTLGGRIKSEIKSLNPLPKVNGKRTINLKSPLNAFETSQQFGEFVDQTNRFSVYKWARDKGMTSEQAAAKVREIQFDYRNSTVFEKEVASRVLPFYRWMRNNLPFQIKQFINDPRKYAGINKLRLNAQSAVGLNEQNVPDWMKESFAMPVSGKNGKGKFLSLNLPLGDLTKLTSPFKTIVDSVTPVAKLPTELAMNRNFFYDKPIKKFAGQQKQFQVPLGGPKFGIDATKAYVLEQLTGQPGRALSGYLQPSASQDQDTKFRMPAMGISSMFKPYDAQQSEYFQQLEKLKSLQDLMSYIEQQSGNKPRTLQKIKKQKSSFFG